MPGPSFNDNYAPKPVTGTRFTDWLLCGQEGRHQASVNKFERWEEDATRMVQSAAAASYTPMTTSVIGDRDLIEHLRGAPTRVG